MTLSDALGLSDAQERLLVRALQAVLGGLVVYGAATVRPRLVANGGLALAVTFLPALLRREYDYRMDPGLVLWITVATALHAFGSLGLYHRFSWYDEITHVVSAMLVAGVGYAAFRAFERHSPEVDVTPEFRAVFIVVFALAFGVVWEVLEFTAVQLARSLGVQSPVTVFGIDDIVTDFVANAVGGTLVALRGLPRFDDLAGFFTRRLRSTDER